jgi:hypothetical protein
MYKSSCKYKKWLIRLIAYNVEYVDWLDTWKLEKNIFILGHNLARGSEYSLLVGLFSYPKVFTFYCQRTSPFFHRVCLKFLVILHVEKRNFGFVFWVNC